MKSAPFGSPPKRELPFINITSLIDVMFLLLIFLLLTTTFNPKLGITLNLPEAKSSEDKHIQSPLRIIVDSKEKIFVSYKESEAPSQTSLNELEKMLSELKNQSSSPKVVLESDGNVPFKTAVAILDILKKNGFTSITIATRQPDQE
ncbi:MAG: biopolymer transporter ExbD [Candidatus Hydrogenedentes bacterium]|nr:biopolymer transporter ExbD [Candidatus Hydrogenedentota bacterium]